MFFDIEKYLRKLAKTSKWQVVYSNSKETSVGLFRNSFDYSYSQILFLNYLAFYSSLSLDIYMGEVNEIVLTNEIYEDAWSYYKSVKDKSKSVITNTPQENLGSDPRSKKFIFHRPPKKI